MIKGKININGYWKVIIYFDIDYNFFYDISNELRKIGEQSLDIKRIKYNMKIQKAKAVTVTNINKKISIVAFNTHYDIFDYFNSIVHEAEHVKQAMLDAYEIEDEGEAPAYTIGYIASRFINIFIKSFVY